MEKSILDDVVFVSQVADGTIYRTPVATILWNFDRSHDPKYQSMTGIIELAQELVASGIAVGIAVMVDDEPVFKVGDARDLE
jgi:hypothetical protein